MELKTNNNGESILIDDIKILTSVIGAEGRQMKAKFSVPNLMKAFLIKRCYVYIEKRNCVIDAKIV
ncbi:hypothetical protein HZI73_25040 [Vallitalea pronyensis]|uniref:Uncharacterized protein n=1 Tax=Vallitalea pronyensis TaxID=1348613 RepID=A0A8J8SJC2_9FIRM|nr:hypothetical protein [Vallitalea pronyensis]QUI25364.1 hypothetical protein HZI73_25040 [Vallitalea pronyensis]